MMSESIEDEYDPTYSECTASKEQIEAFVEMLKKSGPMKYEDYEEPVRTWWHSPVRFDPWAEDEKFPKEDWVREVQNGDTWESYPDWVKRQYDDSYFFATIIERMGDYEFTSRFVFVLPSDIEFEQAQEDILEQFRPDSDIEIEWGVDESLTEEEYEMLSVYLGDLTELIKPGR